MRAGKLNKQISILRSSVSSARSTDGAPIVVWSTLLKNIWARVIPQSGSNETYRDRYRWEVNEVDFETRWTTHTLTADDRVKYDGNDYEIKAVINVDEANVERQIMTKRHS